MASLHCIVTIIYFISVFYNHPYAYFYGLAQAGRVVYFCLLGYLPEILHTKDQILFFVMCVDGDDTIGYALVFMTTLFLLLEHENLTP